MGPQLAGGDELNKIRHRAQGGKEVKRREGIFASADISLPTGIAYLRFKNKRRGRWTYSDRISIVREVYRLVLQEGARNWTAIARHVGVNSNVSVRNMLSNPIYKGWWIIDEKREPPRSSTPRWTVPSASCDDCTEHKRTTPVPTRWTRSATSS